MTEIRRLPGLALQSAARSIIAVLRETEGSAALEFGIVSPIMIYTLLAAADILHGLEISRRLTVAANTLAELTSQVSTTSGAVSDPELTLIFNSLMTTFPDVLSDAGSKGINWPTDIQPIVTEVVFGPALTCTYDPDPNTPPTPPALPPAPTCSTATAVWSVGFNNGNFLAKNRACTGMTPDSTNTDNPSLTSVPAGLLAPGSVIVVDLFYRYTPTFTKWVTGTLSFHRTAYMAPRFFYQLSYTGSGTFINGSGGTNGSGGSICSFSGQLP